MDTAADSDTVSAWTAQMVLAIVKLWVGIVGACQNAVAVEERLVTSVRNLQLLVQAKETEARENAHVDGSDEVVSVLCGSMVQKLVMVEKQIWRSVVEWLEKKFTREAAGLLACSKVS